MHEAVTALREAAETENPTVVFAVTQKAIASALRVIMRADDSSGIIGDACRDLLDLHPRVAEIARPATAQLIDWMIKFQFENECDYFTIDPVAYAPALGELGIARYRAKLDAVAASLGTRPSDDQRWTAPPGRSPWSASAPTSATDGSQPNPMTTERYLQPGRKSLTAVGELLSQHLWSPNGARLRDPGSRYRCLATLRSASVSSYCFKSSFFSAQRARSVDGTRWRGPGQ